MCVCVLLQSGEVQSRDVNLSDLRECEVRLLGTPVTLHINNLDNCWSVCHCLLYMHTHWT